MRKQNSLKSVTMDEAPTLTSSHLQILLNLEKEKQERKQQRVKSERESMVTLKRDQFDSRKQSEESWGEEVKDLQQIPPIRYIFNKLDFNSFGYLTKENLGISNLNGEEMKSIQNFLYILLNQTENKKYFFEDFQRICQGQI